MSRKLVSIALLTSFGLSACASTGGLTPAAAQDLAQIEATAQQVAKGICGLVPTVESIGQIVTVADPTLIGATAVATGTAIANAICKAESAAQGTTSARLKAGRLKGTLSKAVPVRVDGVTVTFQ